MIWWLENSWEFHFCFSLNFCLFIQEYVLHEFDNVLHARGLWSDLAQTWYTSSIHQNRRFVFMLIQIYIWVKFHHDYLYLSFSIQHNEPMSYIFSCPLNMFCQDLLQLCFAIQWKYTCTNSLPLHRLFRSRWLWASRTWNWLIGSVQVLLVLE